jgi:uncharacterized membrane protein
MRERFAAALTGGALLWLTMLVAAPFGLTRDSFAAPATVVYAGASRICHQRPERSFHIAGIQLPVCARCFGLYAAGALGTLLAWRTGPVRRSHARLMLIVSSIPTAATWLLEVLGIAAFSNASRAIAAVPLGAAAGWVFVQMLRYDLLSNGEQVHHRGSRVRSC